MSAQMQWVGYVVLGFGLLACIAVVMLFFSATGQPEAPNQPPDLIADSPVEPAPPASQSPRPAPEPVVIERPERQEDIKIKEIQGVWQARLKDANAVVQIKDGVYRLIISFDYPGLPRRYSNGTYEMKGDQLILTPKSEWGPQKSADGFVEYLPLTSVGFSTLVARSKETLVWMTTPDQTVEYHVFFRLTPEGMVVWTPLK